MSSGKLLAMTILATLALTAISCSGINTVGGRVQGGGSGSTTIGDVFLNDQVKVTDIIITEKEGTKLFKVKLRNTVWFDIAMEGKMDFYDEEGAKLDNPWGWKPLRLEGGQEDMMTFIAPNSKAKKFLLYLQKAGN